LDLEDKSAYDAEISYLNQLSAWLNSHSLSKPPIDLSVRANERKGLNEIIRTRIIRQAEIVYEAQLLLASLDEMARHAKERATRAMRLTQRMANRR